MKSDVGFNVESFKGIKFALTVQLGDPYGSVQNLVIFFMHPSTINWDAVEKLIEKPDGNIISEDLSTSRFSYRCCDYTVGAFLGLVEFLNKKVFRKIPCPVQDVGISYYELVSTPTSSTNLTVQSKELQTVRPA